MGGTSSRPATPEERAHKERERRERENRDILLRKGVLIPPSFGTATDASPPPTSSSCSASSPSLLGVSCSAPHLAVSSHVLGLGNTDGDVISALLARSSAYRLLSSEHLLSGLFVSAGSPSGLANATAGWANDAGTGFLSGAVLLPSYSSAILSGFGGSVSTTSSSSADLAGHFGGFVSKSFDSYDGSNGGQLSTYAYLAGSETGAGNVGSSGRIGDASAPPSQSQALGSSDQSMGKIGWSYSRQLVLDNGKKSSESWPGDEYYKNDPFDKKKSSQSNTHSKNRALVNIGSALTFAPSFSGEGVKAKGASSHVTVSSPTNGLEGAVQVSLPINTHLLADNLSKSTSSQFDPQAIIKSVVSSTCKPQMSGYVSFDLNQVGGGVGEYNPYSQDEVQQGPPIMVTLHQLKGDRNSEAAATISQTFTFDRYVTNPLEQRCPKIRNTVSWAVRLKRSVSSRDGYGPLSGSTGVANANSGNGTNAAAETSLTAGVSYQMNRGLCYKVNADSTGGMTVAIMLKRWAHPRITASALVGTGPVGGTKTSSGIGFKGLCLQIESGPLPSSAPTTLPGTVPASQFVSGDWLYGLAGGGNATVSGETPETKTELPDR